MYLLLPAVKSNASPLEKSLICCDYQVLLSTDALFKLQLFLIPLTLL